MRNKLERTKYPNVYRREDGRIVIRVRARNPRTGRREDRSRLLRPGATARDGIAEAFDLVEEISSGGVRKITPPNVKDYSKIWLKRKLARDEWRDGANTARHCANMIAKHIWPILGDILLDQVTRSDLFHWFDLQTSPEYAASHSKDPDRRCRPVEKYSSGTIRFRWQKLRAIVRDGCAEYGFPDPTTGIKAPPVRSKGGADMVLLPAQIRAVLDDARKNEPNYYPTILLGFASGARVSELVACQVGDLLVDEEIGRWKIRRHVGDGMRIVVGTKTGEGRTAYLDPWSTRELRKMTRNRFPGEFLVRGRFDVQPNRWTINHVLKRIAKRTDVGHITSKAFRQTYITLCNVAGVGSAHTKDQVGHTTDQMLSIYERVPDELRRAAVRTLADVVRPFGGTVGGTPKKGGGKSE